MSVACLSSQETIISLKIKTKTRSQRQRTFTISSRAESLFSNHSSRCLYETLEVALGPLFSMHLQAWGMACCWVPRLDPIEGTIQKFALKIPMFLKLPSVYSNKISHYRPRTDHNSNLFFPFQQAMGKVDITADVVDDFWRWKTDYLLLLWSIISKVQRVKWHLIEHAGLHTVMKAASKHTWWKPKQQVV